MLIAEQMWDSTTWECVREWQGHGSTVWALLVSDTNLISASADGSIKVSAQCIG
jgi:WD40 repeat protein